MDAEKFLPYLEAVCSESLNDISVCIDYVEDSVLKEIVRPEEERVYSSLKEVCECCEPNFEYALGHFEIAYRLYQMLTLEDLGSYNPKFLNYLMSDVSLEDLLRKRLKSQGVVSPYKECEEMHPNMETELIIELKRKSMGYAPNEGDEPTTPDSPETLENPDNPETSAQDGFAPQFGINKEFGVENPFEKYASMSFEDAKDRLFEEDDDIEDA